MAIRVLQPGLWIRALFELGARYLFAISIPRFLGRVRAALSLRFG